MRYLHVRLRGEDATLHPLVPTLTDGAAFTDAKMVAWSPSFDPPRATVLLYLEGDLDRFEAAVRGTDLVIDADVTPVGEGRGYAYVFAEPHPIEWSLFEIGARPGLLPVFPVQYHPDGSLTLRIVGPLDRLREAVDAIPPGVETALERVGEYDLGQAPIPPPLTPRQREVLSAAAAAGYYDVPREAARDDVAASLGCAPSTASEHLQKAEARLVRTFLDAP